jgi:uncharacterized membrane protein YphA (DoxX/SURF4 family)
MRNGITWVLSILVALAFLGAGLAKLSGAAMMRAEFGIFGYPLWFMYLTGTLEIVGAALLLVPRLAGAGAALLSCIMVGAIFSHLTHNQAGMTVAPLVLLVLAAVVGSLRGWSRGTLTTVSA